MVTVSVLATLLAASAAAGRHSAGILQMAKDVKKVAIAITFPAGKHSLMCTYKIPLTSPGKYSVVFAPFKRPKLSIRYTITSS